MTTAAILRRARLPDAIRNTGLLAAIAFPAVLINLGHGQNGFLTAGLFASALLALPKRPILAGILLASMAYKPQFALVIPLALLAARQWQAFASAAAAVIGLIALTSAIFGIDIWSAFMATGELSRKLLLEQGEVGFAKLQSTFAVARMWSAGIMLAYLLQGLITAVVIISAAWAWRTTTDTSVRAAILLIAALLASPHVLDYDLMLLGPAIAFMVVAGTTSGFHRYEITLLAAAWAVPLLARPVAEASGIPLGWATLIALLHRGTATCDDSSPTREGGRRTTRIDVIFSKAHGVEARLPVLTKSLVVFDFFQSPTLASRPSGHHCLGAMRR